MAIPIPKGVPSPLSLGTLVGAPNGMSRGVPQHELPDTNAWTIVDANLNDPGFIYRRGPLAETSSSTRATSRAVGISRCQDPAGTEQVLVFSAKTGSAASEYYGFANTAITASSYPYNFSVNPYEHFDSKDALLGGAFVGSASSYDGTPANSALSLWRGASKDDASNVLITGTTAQGGLTIVVTSAIASCCSGQFVFDHSSGKLVGVIKSISGSTITLEHPALVSTTTAIDVKALRGLNPRVSTGRITTSTTSAVVNGGMTKFSAQGLTSSWDLFTPDFTYIGSVSSVASNAQLTLTGNAAVALVNSPYLAINQTGSYSQLSPSMGWMNASFAGHQFFAKGNLVAFSDITDPEALDLTLDGNTFTVSADPIRALIPGLDYLVIVTETEAYALQGAIGTTPDKWRPERISDDGTICGMTAVPYLGGCMWAGKRGIWYYDGTQVQNIVSELDNDYRTFIAPFSSASSRAYSAVCNDHLLVFVESGATGVFQRTNNQTVTNITRPTFVINLATGALNIWENVEFRGSIQPPDRLGRGTCLLPITTTEAGPVHNVRVINGDTLWTHSGLDAYLCEGAPQQGPLFHLETKKYDMGDSQRLKSFRMVLLNYLSATAAILVDTVAGLNATGVQQASQYPISTTYQDKRIRIDVRSQFISLRFNQANATTTQLALASWGLGFKWKRPGRV